MSKYTNREITDKKSWERFILANNPGTFLQSWNWGETNKLVGFQVARYGIYHGNKLFGALQLIEQPAKRGRHYLVPGGPVISYDDKELVGYTKDFIMDFARKNKAWFVRIRPDIVDSQKTKDMLATRGFIQAPMHLHGEHTLILDLSNDEGELLKAMRKNTRYAIRKSLSEGYKVVISDDANDVRTVYNLQTDTVKRHHFVGFSEKLFRAQLTSFGSDRQAKVFICHEKSGVPLVAAIVIFYGNKAFYHHSGSSDAARRTNASYFMQWQIIKYAKRMGYANYDFWGIAPTDDPKHRFAGVTTFKKGFGGVRVDWLHAHDLPASSKYWLTHTFENIRRKTRHL